MAEAVLTKVKIRPLGDRVLVKPMDKEKQERGGLIIPDTAKEKPQEGEIIAVRAEQRHSGLNVTLALVRQRLTKRGCSVAAQVDT